MTDLIKKRTGTDYMHFSSYNAYFGVFLKTAVLWLMGKVNRCFSLVFSPWYFLSGHHHNIKGQTKLNSTPSLDLMSDLWILSRPCNWRRRPALKCVLNFNIFSYWPLFLSTTMCVSALTCWLENWNILLAGSQEQREKLSKELFSCLLCPTPTPANTPSLIWTTLTRL